MTNFQLNLIDQGQSTRRKFLSDLIDDYREIPVQTIKNYKPSRRISPENKPKFLSVSNGREFYYLIDDVKIKDVSLENSLNKTQQFLKLEEKQTKDNFSIIKSKQIFDQSQVKRLDNLKDQENIFKTKIDSDVTSIDITDQLKKIKLFFPGRDTVFIKIPKDPNEIGAKFILKGVKPKNPGDFKKV